MASAEPTPLRLPFQPRPERSDILSVMLMWHLAARVVERESGCWEWTGNLTKAGYGTIHDSRPNANTNGYVHRIVADICIGDLVGDLQSLHHCDNRCCCRPSHLFIGTQQDNVDDMLQKNRGGQALNPAKGEKCIFATLTEQQVIEIRRRVSNGERTGEAMAKEYGIIHSTLRRIVTGKHWKHVE